MRALPVAVPERWLVLALVVAALLSRVFTTNSLAGEPTSDEYYFGIYARDVARAWASGEASASLAVLTGEGRTIALQAAALTFVLPWDAITLGRTLQALFNALTIPLTYLLARQVGLPSAAAGAAALLLLAAPEFQETAWRYWSDSQATLLGLAYLAALLRFAVRPSLWAGLLAPFLLLLLLLTKDSAAATFAPFLLVALAPMRKWVRSWRTRLAFFAALALLAFAGAAGLLLGGSLVEQVAQRLGPLGRIGLVGQRILGSAWAAVPEAPAYAAEVAERLGATNTGVGLTWAWAVGGVWLTFQAARALVGVRGAPVTALGWTLALGCWLPALVVAVHAIGQLASPIAWTLLALAGVLIGAGALPLVSHPRPTRATRRVHGVQAVPREDADRLWVQWRMPARAQAVRAGQATRAANSPGVLAAEKPALSPSEPRQVAWALALLGLVVAAFLAQRLLAFVTPDLRAAFTARTFMPILPLLAILAGAGVWGLTTPMRRLLPRAPWSHAVAATAVSVLLVGVWSPLLDERLSMKPLLGRVADRGADPASPQGLRVQALVEAEPWLRAHLRPTDQIVTGLPRHLAWYADLGIEGLEGLVNLGAQARTVEERAALIRDYLGPEGAAYAVDFNIDWWRPESAGARQWQQHYAWLAARPNVEIAYLRLDPSGQPVFYVARNHGYALAPTHRPAPVRP